MAHYPNMKYLMTFIAAVMGVAYLLIKYIAPVAIVIVTILVLYGIISAVRDKRKGKNGRR